MVLQPFHINTGTRWLCSFLLGLIILGCGFQQGWAAPKTLPDWKQCSVFHKGGYFVPAADCYIKSANSMIIEVDSPESLRVRKWYLYKEAAKNLEKAAKKADRIEVAGYLRSRALKLMRRALKKKWVPKVRGKRRGRVTRALINSILEKIQYTPLGVSTGNSAAQIVIQGYKTKIQTKGSFNQKLRPGRYRVVVRYPKKVPKAREVNVRPKRSVVLTFVEDEGLPKLSWVGYTLGIASVVAGGVLIGLGIEQSVSSTSCFNAPDCSFKDGVITPNSTDVGDGVDNRAAWGAYQTRAAILGIVGGVLFATGITLVALGGKQHSDVLRNRAKQREKTVQLPPAFGNEWQPILVSGEAE